MAFSFADPLPVWGKEGALRKPKDASSCKSGGEPLPYPTTADGKDPWPAIHAEREAERRKKHGPEEIY